MNNFDKGKPAISSKKSGGMNHDYSNGNGFGSNRQDEVDAATSEEQQPLMEPVVGNKHQAEMDEKGSLQNGHGESSGKTMKESKPCEDFEEILNLVGAEQKFQKILLYGVICPIVATTPFLLLHTIFLWDVPEHWCYVPGKDPGMHIDEWKNLTLPREMGYDGQMRFSQCKMYNQTSGETIKCQAGWEYDTTDYSSTVPSEFNWVCDHNHYATDCFVWGGIGGALGTIIFGIMADKYGRRPAFFSSCIFHTICKSVALFLPQYYTWYKYIQLLGSIGGSGLLSITALLCAEVSGTDYRAWIYAVTWMIWVVGNALLPFVAMLCRDWFLFGIVCLAPGYLIFIYFPALVESPRWQITVGKVKPAIKTIHKIAKTNGRKVEPGQIERMVDELAQKQKRDAKNHGNVGVWTLFSKFNLAKNTFLLCTAFTMSMLLYSAVTLNSTKMAGNKFLNYFGLAIIELPGGWIAGKLVETTGRRWTQAGFFVMCTLCCLVCATAVSLAFEGSTIIVFIAAIGIKFGISITSLVVYLQGTEIFPTQLRSTGTGLATTVSLFATISGPYIVYSGTVHAAMPYVILVACSFIGMLSSMCLPETFKQNLPETVEDANKFGKDHKFWSYLPLSQDTENLKLEEKATS